MVYYNIVPIDNPFIDKKHVIYYKNIKLSHYIIESDKIELINTISQKINLIKNKRQYSDVMDYIRNKYSHTIQSMHIKLGSK
jgi:hypothetical protein